MSIKTRRLSVRRRWVPPEPDAYPERLVWAAKYGRPFRSEDFDLMVSDIRALGEWMMKASRVMVDAVIPGIRQFSEAFKKAGEQCPSAIPPLDLAPTLWRSPWPPEWSASPLSARTTSDETAR